MIPVPMRIHSFLFAHKVGGLEDGEVPDHLPTLPAKGRKRTKILTEFIQILLAQELFHVLSAHLAKTPRALPQWEKITFSKFPGRSSGRSNCYEHLGSYLKSK